MKNNIIMCLLSVAVMVLGVFSTGRAQNEAEIYASTEALREMDQGVELMNQGQFVKANTYFMRVLENVEVVPADLCFYFGKNSYHLSKYKQSMDWLNKYLELKGTRGQFSDQATEYLQLAQADYTSAAEAPDPPVIRQKSRSKPKSIDCERHPYVKCPVCNGDGVVIVPGKLGSLVYQTCPYSDESGRMTCEDYQAYLRGNLEVSP